MFQLAPSLVAAPRALQVSKQFAGLEKQLEAKVGGEWHCNRLCGMAGMGPSPVALLQSVAAPARQLSRLAHFNAPTQHDTQPLFR